MKTLAENGSRQRELFPSTHWSVVLAAGRSQAEPELARAALAELCQTYWAPLYNFVRSRGYTVDDAQDLTQSFFAYLIERKIYSRVDRQKGKFRLFARVLKISSPTLRSPTHPQTWWWQDFASARTTGRKCKSIFQNHSSTSNETALRSELGKNNSRWARALSAITK